MDLLIDAGLIFRPDWPLYKLCRSDQLVYLETVCIKKYEELLYNSKILYVEILYMNQLVS